MSATRYMRDHKYPRTRPPLSRSAIVIWSAIVGFVGGTIATWIGSHL